MTTPSCLKAALTSSVIATSGSSKAIRCGLLTVEARILVFSFPMSTPNENLALDHQVKARQ